MRKYFRIILAASVLWAFVSVPPAHATNDFDYHYTYYNSSLNEVGHWREDCDHEETSDGTLDGEWLQIEYISCATVGHFYEYWHKCNGSWHLVSFVGDTRC
ncbi:MAG TPA: hypothetical protein VJ276_06370 [Thermoanaerobaculia bacterium]|nr:hypothetical protein [Thermoanaerobaculia bacterium]